MRTSIITLFVVLSASISTFAQDQTALEKIASEIRDDITGSAYIKSLKPSMADIEVIFSTQENCELVDSYVNQMFASITEGAVKPGAHRSETIVLKINSSKLKQDAPHNLPGGYSMIKDKFNENITIYGLKFVEPGKTLGYSLNAFFFVNDHWVCIPKAYRAFSSK